MGNHNLREIRIETKLLILLSLSCVTVPETPSAGDSVSSDFILAKSRAGSEFASYTFVQECEGSCELQNRPSQATFSLWNTLESSLAAGN